MPKTNSGLKSLSILRGYVNSSSNWILRVAASRIFLLLIFAWYIVQTLFIAFSTRQGIPPDENYHLSFIRLFSENGWLPFFHNQTGHYELGAVSRTPFFLYHYLLSLPNHFFGSGSASLYALRLINILIGLGSMYLVYRLMVFLRTTAAVRNLSLFMLSNTLMFLFLSSAVSYDNLFIFLTLSSLLLVCQLKNSPSLHRLLLLLVSLAAGLMIKVNFIPVALIVIAVLIFTNWPNRQNFIKSIKSSAAKMRSANLILGLILILLLSLLAQLYVVNLVRYHALSPQCTKVLTIDQCRQNHIFERTERLGKSSHPAPIKNNYEYLASWSFLMDQRTFGIFSHKSVQPTRLISYFSLLYILVGVMIIIRSFNLKDTYIAILLTVFIFYSLVLLADNFRGYQRYGSVTFAVQGRYLLALLPVFYILVNTYTWKLISSSVIKGLLALIIILVFATAGLPSYIYQTSPAWHTGKSTSINNHLKHLLHKVR